ncbi:hypothetical protein, partial [Cellulomonas sp. P5_C6]
MIDTEAPPVTDEPPAPRRARRPRWVRTTVAAVVAIVLASLLVSYVGALTAPGQADWQDRSVGWVRDHGGNGVVNRIENWWYSRHAPAGGTPDPGVLPAWSAGRAAATG